MAEKKTQRTQIEMHAVALEDQAREAMKDPALAPEQRQWFEDVAKELQKFTTRMEKARRKRKGKGK